MNNENRNEEKFILLYRHYVDEVYRYVSLRVGFDSSASQDITQDTFLDVYKGMNSFKGLCSEKTWIFRIAKNKLYDYYRRQYRQSAQTIDIDDELAEQLSDDAQNIEQTMESIADSRTVCKVVQQTLSALAPPYRTVLLLKYVDRKSVRQIADVIQKSPKAAESELQRARKAFMKRYLLFMSNQEREEPCL